MRFTHGMAVAAVAGLLVMPGGVEAANKEHQQLMAEIRMLQEQQQQLQQMLGGLADTLKTVTAKLDEQTGVNRKAFADQKLLIEGIGEGVRILREKADDANVRLSTVSQELEAMRQTIAQSSTAAPLSPTAGTETSPGEPSVPSQPPTGAAPAVVNAPPPNVAPQRMYDQAYADYAAGQWDLAVIGFETYIKMFPRSVQADDAQLNIGNALYSAGKFKEALAAFQKLIGDYPTAETVPDAYYKMGLTYDRLGQPELARKAFETVIAKYATSPMATLAKQRLDTMKK